MIAEPPGWRRRLGKALLKAGHALAPPPEAASGLPKPPPVAGPTPAAPLPQPAPPPAPPPNPNDLLPLFDAAMTAETPEGLVEFAAFCARFGRHSIFNARLIQVQRRGARACATREEWRRAGRWVMGDAQPIIILWPFGPVRFVYDIADTGPAVDRDAVGDSFAAMTRLPDAKLVQALETLRAECAKAKQFRIHIEGARLGWNFAGSAAGQGALPVPLPDDMAARAHALVATAAGEAAKVGQGKSVRWVPSWRVRVNDRMTPAEQFVTLAHELGHIFCGHLGACGRDGDSAGWPARHGLAHAAREMEAEAVAWLVAQRAGVMSRSAEYLKRYVGQPGAAGVNTDLVVRAASRVEALAGLRYAEGPRA